MKISTIFQLPIILYRYTLSSLIGRECRFQPSCSEYALEALRLHNPLYAGYLITRRVLSCHPWGRSGYDPVPPCIMRK